MAGATLTTPIRRRLSAFAREVASPFTDTRRQGFATAMITGLVAAGHAHLTALARGTSDGAGNIHAAGKRLSRHLGSEHRDAAPPAAELLRRSARVTVTYANVETVELNYDPMDVELLLARTRSRPGAGGGSRPSG
jgi:hypothetical protein